MAPALFSRSCFEQEGRPLDGKHSELRNTVIRTACIDLRYRGGSGKRDCHSYETDIIFDALKLYNATVVNTFYTGARPLGIDMFHGLIDVHRNLGAAHPVSLREFHTPGLIMYWYESFYVKRENLVLLSFQDMLDESMFFLALVSVTLVSAMIFLALADALRVGRCNKDALTNSFMVLLASFYSTCYSIPRIGRWTGLGAFVCGVWMMGILPFSNYFRSELTTRMTLRSFPDHMDNLAELERALDERRVVPCVVKDTFLHTRLTSNQFIAILHRMLRSAFGASKDREELLQPTYSHCLNCALKKGRFCYTPSLPSWFRSSYKGELVESREHVIPILLTIAIRKNYAHLRGLRDVIRKIIEGGMLRPPEKDLRDGLLQNYDTRTSFELSLLMVEEFVSFLVVFVALLGATSVVFLAELSFRGRKNEAPADDMLEESKFCLALVSVTLLSTMIFLALAGALRVGRCNMDALTNSFMFLLASFYSTSYSIPRIGRLTGLGALVCGVWMMGMLPFSNYFRSELTTRVTLRAFPDHMDTLAELERALDESRVAPCVVKDTFFHELVTSAPFIGNLHRKLRTAFLNRKDREELVQTTYIQCLKCALTKGRFCYSPSLPPWFKNPYKADIVESREHVNPILLTIAIRKNYPHIRGLRELVRKIIEGGMMRPPEKDLRDGHLQNYDTHTTFELSPLMVEEFTSFLVVFVALLGATTVVFLAELFFRGRKNEAPADVSEA
ncbi:hypothetical protein HPB50_014065 [Hyalomma asiaticum]|uniref:Uncharacterized protein n=1 Tax=Hyalomma asiaticum TaxID=266040 RepID=A0ACB7RUP5_HYAAI|nr:hypothetical protein HPB50_014065 [Hyalomma asiaticum]